MGQCDHVGGDLRFRVLPNRMRHARDAGFALSAGKQYLMGMKETVTCTCGAVYEKGSYKLPVRDQDYFDCLLCGTRLDEWSSSRIPTYKLIKRP